MHKIFEVNFESRDSDHIAVSGAPNNPGIHLSNAPRVLVAALVESFV